MYKRYEYEKNEMTLKYAAAFQIWFQFQQEINSKVTNHVFDSMMS